MHPIRKQRLILTLFVVVAASVVVGLISYALRENINLFYPPSAIVAGEAPVGRAIRGGGCVLPGSVKRSGKGLELSFIVTDGAANLKVEFEGILPDLVSEGQAGVVNGTMDDNGVFQATEVLAKHDESYTPPEVSESMAAASSGEHQATCEGVNYGS